MTTEWILTPVFCSVVPDIPEWLLSDEGRPVHVTLTPTDVLATLGTHSLLYRCPPLVDLMPFAVGRVVAVGAATVVASKQAAAPFTLTNAIALCIVTELLQLISLGS